MAWTKTIDSNEITDKITNKTVEFAKDFGTYLGKDENGDPANPRRVTSAKLTTSQLRKFFGEVKRQQMQGYNETDFVLLKPKLAYAVGRATGNNPKIKDFYAVISNAIDLVKKEAHFKNFIKFFEAIVAYHKAAEQNVNI